jgi:hypothetical protein
MSYGAEKGKLFGITIVIFRLFSFVIGLQKARYEREREREREREARHAVR